MLNIQSLSSPHKFASNCYLISACGEYAVVDPSAPYAEGICQGSVRYVLLTHAHFDHIWEVASWVENSSAEIIILDAERGALSDPMRNCFKLYNGTDNGYFGTAREVSDGEMLPLGDTEIRVMSCPGHTIGSATYVVGNIAFVGDTVFEGGGYGRCDLPTSSPVMLIDSIKKIISLPEDTQLYCGHGDPTTVKQYKIDLNFS
jgi:glyoxylase-like metal-dependent hydrolase (beta-lactamase superfamily II)